jgi:uncharacterized protein (TIGR00369 family)
MQANRFNIQEKQLTSRRKVIPQRPSPRLPSLKPRSPVGRGFSCTTGAHLNPWGTVHGGLTATLLDSCMGLAIQSKLEKGIGSTTLEFKISLVRSISLETGQLRAEGQILNCGRRVGTAEGRVTHAKGRLLAHGTTTCLISRAKAVAIVSGEAVSPMQQLSRSKSYRAYGRF